MENRIEQIKEYLKEFSSHSHREYGGLIERITQQISDLFKPLDLKDLIEEIATLIREKHKPQNKWSVPPDILAKQILSLVSSYLATKNLVEVDDGKCPDVPEDLEGNSTGVFAYLLAQVDMLKAGFKKVRPASFK